MTSSKMEGLKGETGLWRFSLCKLKVPEEASALSVGKLLLLQTTAH